jgi:hypothetical protein
MANETNRPVQTFREGAVGVSVWKRSGSQGDYYEFTLARSYVKNENEAALVKVIAQAAEFIRNKHGEEKKAA